MQTQLKARLGLLAVTSIVVGSMIGSGIFKKPGLMASQLGDPRVLLLVWIVAGIITLFGALTNAEVAAMFPETGGQYVFFQKMYGNFTAYLYGWAIFSVIQTGSIASITYVFSEVFNTLVPLPRLGSELEKAFVIHLPFIGDIFPMADLGVKGLTIGVIFLLTFVNYRGVLLGAGLQVLFTGLKILAILALVLLAFTATQGSFENLTAFRSATAPQGFQLLAAIIAALSGAFWAYDGWNNVSFVSGEVKDPQRNMPRGLFLGAAIVIGVYMIVNFAYLYVFPVNEMAQSKIVAMDVARRALGASGVAFISVCIMLSTFGASSSSVLASARVYFAMARRKMFFPSIGQVHPKFQTPANALWIQAFWASALVMSGTFDTLTDMLIFVTWIFYALSAFGVFVLRRKYPHLKRPYKVWGYPFVPALFVVFAMMFVVITLYNDVSAYQMGRTALINSVFGLFLVVIGAPFYFYFQRKTQ